MKLAKNGSLIAIWISTISLTQFFNKNFELTSVDQVLRIEPTRFGILFSLSRQVHEVKFVNQRILS